MVDLNSANGMKGYLSKWTNYLKGYQTRWFVLQNGLLSYYRNQAEVTHTCRGTINLANAKITSNGPSTFVISNSSTQTFHLKAANELEQKKWVSALTIGKAKALALGKTGDDSDDWEATDESEDSDMAWLQFPRLMPEDGARLVEQALSHFEARINDLQHYQDTLRRKSDDLQKSVADLESATEPAKIDELFQCVKNRATVYKVACMAMVNSCGDFLKFSRTQSLRWKRIFAAQVDKRALLEQMVEELAKQLRQLEMQARHKSPYSSICFPGAFPGQAVAVPVSGGSRNPASSVGICGKGGTLRKNSLKDGGVSHLPNISDGIAGIGSQTSATDEDDEDFYDAEDDVEFDVTLPTLHNQNYSDLLAGIQNTKLPGGNVVKMASDENSSTSSTGNIVIGGDLAMDYESEYSDSDGGAPDLEEEEYDSAGKASCSIKPPRRPKRRPRAEKAHVIQKHGWSKSASTDVQDGDATISSSPSLATSAQPMAVASNVTGSSLLKSAVSPPSKGKIIPVRKSIVRRTTLPPKPNISLNLWSILKNCIGKELTKIPMPVNFSEPLSFLQRLTETFEYSDILDRAAACTDPLEQLAYVAAFSVSSYAITAVRVNKPFNPLLNETFECDRTDDLGWRSLAEQVSHHPPIAAFHCESDAWYTWFDFSMSSKFRGRYLQIKVIGICHLVFRATGHHYSWTKIPLTVNNIIVGRLWIDNSGEIDITNHTTDDICHLTFKPYSYFSNDTPRRVTGAVSDSAGRVHGILNGTWDEYIDYAPVVASSGGGSRGKQAVLETGPPMQLWRVRPLPKDAEKIYNFTNFAITLNDMEEGVCPTDCRLRPDQRLMEEGKWDEANAEKARLEDKQRARRRQMAALAVASVSAANSQLDNSSITSETDSVQPSDTLDQSHEPLWFRKEVDQATGVETRIFTGKYWKCKAKKDWSMCPDLY